MKVCHTHLGNTTYHRIIVTVHHDGAATSEVNILLPPVAHLCSWGKKKIVKLNTLSLADLYKKKIHRPGLT